MTPLLNHEIGTHAGAVYRSLNETPRQSAAALRKATGLTSREVDLALGWLARESKLAAEREGRVTRYFLAGTEGAEA